MHKSGQRIVIRIALSTQHFPESRVLGQTLLFVQTHEVKFMNRFSEWLAAVIPCVILISIGIAACDSGGGDDLSITRFTVLADTHFYDTSLGVSGNAFEEYVSNDRKLIAESVAINTVLKDILIDSNVEFVLIAGDLTKDGVRQSHDLMASYLAEIEAAGKKVFVVPGNHDILNTKAYSYPENGEPVLEQNVTPEEFVSIYGPFGYEEALYRDPNSLTYIANPKAKLWILGIDSCNYGDRFQGSSWVAGNLSDETLAWIADKLTQAKAEGITVLGLMHHGLVEHFPQMELLFADYLLNGWYAKAKQFSSMGVNIVFTGHHHATDISQLQTEEDSVIDVQTGSPLTWQCPYRFVKYDADTNRFDLDNRIIKKIDFDTGVLDFQAYALDSLENGIEDLVQRYLAQMGMDEESITLVESIVIKTLLAYTAGDEMEQPNSDANLNEVQQVVESDDAIISFLGQVLQGVWEDDTPDGDVTIDLTKMAITYR